MNRRPEGRRNLNEAIPTPDAMKESKPPLHETAWIISGLVEHHTVKLSQCDDDVRIICSPRDTQEITLAILHGIHDSISFQK